MALIITMLLLGVTEVGTCGIAIFSMAGLLLAWSVVLGALRRLKVVRPRFTLRSILIATTFLGMGMAWLSVLVDRVVQEERIVAQIFAQRGNVTFQDTKGPRIPDWVYRRFGIAGYLAVGRIDLVRLEKIPVSHAVIESLRDLRFRGLSLNLSSIQNDDLLYVGRLKQLEKLRLQHTSISDDGLEHLTGLDNLQELDLCGSKIKGNGLAQLAHMTSLRELNLNRTSISDQEVSELKQLTMLRSLHLRYTSITDQAVEDLQKALPDCEIHR